MGGCIQLPKDEKKSLEFIIFGGGGVLLRTAAAIAVLPDDGADRNPVGVEVLE